MQNVWPRTITTGHRVADQKGLPGVARGFRAGLFAVLGMTAGATLIALLIATAIPITVAVNVLRIVTVAVALISFDVDLTSGAAHEWLGYFVFALTDFVAHGTYGGEDGLRIRAGDILVFGDYRMFDHKDRLLDTR